MLAEFTSAVLTDNLSSGRHSKSPAMSALTCLHLRSRVTPLAWSQTHTTPAEQPGARGIASATRGVSPDCGTSTEHGFQSAEHATKPRQRQWKGAGNPRMPFLKQAYPHHSSKRPEGFAAAAQKWGPG